METLTSSALKGQHVVLIGGSSGMGLATAKLVKRQGGRVTLVGRTQEQLLKAAEQIDGAETFVMDMADRKSIESVFKNVATFDHLVITAGRIHAGMLAETDPDQLLQEVNEHVAGSLYIVKAAVSRIRANGSMVLMGGQFSDRPQGNGTSVMALACRGIEAFAQSMALEFKPLRFNVIAPGFIETSLYDVFGPEGRSDILKKAASSLPVGRIGQPEEVADAITFLLRNGYMNGEVLHIDGGGRLV